MQILALGRWGSDRILNVNPEGEQKALLEFRREIEKGCPAVRLAVPMIRSCRPAKVRRLGQRAGVADYKVLKGLPVDRELMKIAAAVLTGRISRGRSRWEEFALDWASKSSLQAFRGSLRAAAEKLGNVT